MNKTELLNKFAKDPEERTVLAHALDRMELARTRAAPAATKFLSPELRARLEGLLRACCDSSHLFFGGYEGAERTVCVFLPDWLEDGDWAAEDELAAIEAAYPLTGAELTHRDLLGGLMGIGLTRERVGDILTGDAAAQIVCLKDAAPIILSQFSQAGRCKLKLKEISLAELSPAPAEVKLIHATASTLRLDAVAAAGFSLSRSKAAGLIQAGRMSVNHRECLKPDKLVEEGDVFTCRGLGKCVLKAVGGQSRKGRIIIEMERYL